MELPSGFEPLVIELQSIALPTWLRKHLTQRLNSLSNSRDTMQVFFNFFVSLKEKTLNFEFFKTRCFMLMRRQFS